MLGGYGSPRREASPTPRSRSYARGRVRAVGSSSYPEADRPTKLYPQHVRVAGPRPPARRPGANDSARTSAIRSRWWAGPTSARATGAGSATRHAAPGSVKARETTRIGGSATPACRTTPSLRPPRPRRSTRQHPDEGWKIGGSLNIPRSYQNTVLLPDGRWSRWAAVSASTAGRRLHVSRRRPRPADRLFDPRGSGQLGPARMEDRGYHSTAVLLPDGRVFSGGDDHPPYGEADGSRPPPPPTTAELLAAVSVRGPSTADQEGPERRTSG